MVGGTWFCLSLPLLVTCCFYQIIYLSRLVAFGALQLYIWYENLWDSCCTTSLKWVVYYTSSGPWPSPALLWYPCPPPTHSYWSPYILWRVSMMRWSRGWISTSQFINWFSQQCRYCSSIPQYAVWIWGYLVLTYTYPWSTAYTWCMRILRVCQGAPFLKWQKHCGSIILGFEGVCSPECP